MSASMARQRGQVQLEQSDMRLALNMPKMAKEGFAGAAIEATYYRIKKPLAEVWAEKIRGVEFSGHKMVKAEIHRDPAMLRQNQMAGCLPWQNATAKNPQTPWTCKGTGAPQPDRCSERTTEPTQPLPGTPPTPTGNTSRVQACQMVNLPARYTYSNTALPSAEIFG